MQKLITGLAFIGALMAGTANAADVVLEDTSLILGKWKLYAEAPALHKEKTKVNINWEFKDNGIIHTWAKDSRARTGDMSINVAYSVEDGVIKKQVAPGRSKYEKCRVVKLEGKDMTLKCQYLYFFMEKQ